MTPQAAALLDALSDLVILVGADGSIIWANRAFVRAAALPLEDLLQHNLFDLVETPIDMAKAHLQRCAGSRQPLPGNLAFKQMNGVRLECRCDGVVLTPDAELPVPTILLRCRPKLEAASQFIVLNQKISQLSREILQRRGAEGELRELNQTLEVRAEERAREIASAVSRLQETESAFAAMVSAITDYAIFILDPGGFVRSWNTGAQRIKGYLADEIIGLHFSRFYTDEDRANGVPERALAIAKRTGKFEAEGWRVRKNGSEFWASIVLQAIYDDARSLVGFTKVTRDMTERRAAEERLRQAQKMEAIGQLTGGIAHDFNNILTVIGGNIETIRRQFGPSNETLERMLGLASRGVDRASTLTQRLLAFSRRQPLDPKPVAMNRLVIGMSDMLERTIGENIKIETVLSGGLWPVSVDPNQLENAILNLAVNARHAMANGGKLTLETANTRLDEGYAAIHEDVNAGQYVMLAVSDTGLGMTREVMEKAFEPFFTTKQMGEGTGLGLSQVYGFVKQSGGHIKLYSEPGEGTTVRMYFPRVTTAEAHDENIPERDAAPTAKANVAETILVVEDDSDVRAYSTEVLRELGYNVIEAGEADTALSLLATRPEIKLLFTDVGLPGPLNGRQLAGEARNRRPNLKILFTTGYARNAIVHHGRLDPGVELIVKPFTYSALAAKVRLVLDKRAPAASSG